MAHCGFEGTAVNDAFSHPLKAMLTSLRGPKVTGPMAPELPIQYPKAARYAPPAPSRSARSSTRESHAA
jgi:hypothetical protein